MDVWPVVVSLPLASCLDNSNSSRKQAAPSNSVIGGAETDRSPAVAGENKSDEWLQLLEMSRAECRKQVAAEIRKLNLRAHELLCSLYAEGQTNFSKFESPETIIDDEEKFQVILKTGPFAANEISVKGVNRTLVITASHIDKKDEHGFAMREICRKYHLPETVKWNEIVVRLTPEGVLTVDAAKHATKAASNVTRFLPIIRS